MAGYFFHGIKDRLVMDARGNHDWANLAYSYTGLISEFINNVIVNGEHRRSKIRITPKNKI